MKHSQFLIFICLGSLVKGASKYYDGENRPYEFGYNIEGNQHRHEKKDENGIIMGEFGFITADGVYHVTAYATDENGNFKILFMKNIKIGLPGEPGSKPVPKELQPELPVRTRPKAQPYPTVMLNPSDTRSCSGCSIPRPQLNVIAARKQSTAGAPSSNAIGSSRDSPALFRPLSQRIDDPSIKVTLPVSAGGAAPGNASPGGAAPGSAAPGSAAPGSAASGGAAPGGAAAGDAAPGGAAPGSAASGGAGPRSAASGGAAPGGAAPGGAAQQIPGGGGGRFSSGGSQSRAGGVSESIGASQSDVRGGGSLAGKSSQSQAGTDGGISSGDSLLRKPASVDMDRLGEGLMGLLYRFNYTAGYHGHHEEGDFVGTKDGGYEFIGRDGLKRTVDYLANEFGYQPHLVQETVKDEDIPRPETEKEKGLQGYEFKWFNSNKL